MPNLTLDFTTGAHARQRKPTIYVASSLGTYHSPRYNRLLRVVRRQFPRGRVIPARGLFRDSNPWRSAWPILRSSISVLVFFPDVCGWIGFGVWRELHDVAALGRPVFLLLDDGRLVPFQHVTFGPVRTDDWIQFARVSARKARMN
jgi:hypothetical protein